MARKTTPTHVLLNQIELSSSTSSMTLSNIPQDYGDLVLVIAGSGSSASGLEATINSSTGMSTVYFYGDGANPGSGTATNVAIIGQVDSGGGVSTTHFLDYTATDKHKTFITRGDRAGGITVAYVNRWASTAAINSIGMTTQAGSLNSGTVISLYGVYA